MRTIGIILARGGSKRLPAKNLIDLGGTPMITWTIRAALSSSIFEDLIVSTDSPEIADIAISAGASVPFLRSEAADDYTSSSDATLFALSQAERHYNRSYDCVAQLMANCPFRNDIHIKEIYNRFLDLKCDSIITAFKLGWMNPWWSSQIDEEGRPTWLFPNARTQRSQDLPNLYCPSGAIWLAQTTCLKKFRSFYTPDVRLHPIDWISAMDIDEQADLDMARAILNLKCV